jgi:hypothetical protein
MHQNFDPTNPGVHMNSQKYGLSGWKRLQFQEAAILRGSNMNNFSTEKIVAVVRNNGKISWYRSERELWILDLNKWRKEFIDKGYELSNIKGGFRNGIFVVDTNTKDKFLQYMSKYEIDRDELSRELAERFHTAKSWWDVGDLFPIIFVDFDMKQVGAFYPGGIPMERYVPNNWNGKFIDFATEYSKTIFPDEDKFWIKEGCDLLKILNERASKAD